MDGLDKSKMLELIDEYSGLEKKNIGKIDIKGAYSFFEVEKELTDKVVRGFNGVEYKGRQVRVEVTDARSSGSSGSSSRGGEAPRPRKRIYPDKKFSDNKGFKRRR